MRVREIGEFAFIDSIAEDTLYRPETVVQGIGDDCAIYLATEGMEQLVSTDMMVEGIHFSAVTTSPFDVGYRLGTANISDIAAMGGLPRQIVVAVALPSTMTMAYMQEFYRGLKTICKTYGVNIIGGDTVSTRGPLVVNVTVLGEVSKGEAVLRSGARPGDWIGVTNTVGSAATGLQVLLAQSRTSQRQKVPPYTYVKQLEGSEEYPYSLARHQRPEPQVALGNFLRKHGATAMNDISDGLASELNEIAVASHCSLLVEEDLLPLHEESLRWVSAQSLGRNLTVSLCRHKAAELAWYGGEDFQLVFTIGDIGYKKLKHHTSITFIGRVIEMGKAEVLCRQSTGDTVILPPRGYTHF